MQNENIRNALLNRNMQAAPRQQIQPNENNKNKEKEKEKYVRSQKMLNRSNHVHYNSKSSNQGNVYNSNKGLEITKKSSCNEIDNDYIDHPQPLLSENEEDLEELKAQFIKKEETKEKETTKNVVDVNSNVENTKITKGTDHVAETKIGSLIIEKTVEENNNKKKINLLCRKRSENIMPLKKKYKYGTIPISSIKAHAYFKLNNVNKNSDYNIDKKEEENSELIYAQNTLKKELNNNNKKSSCQNSSLNILIENNNKRNILKRIKTEKENCNYLNISNDNNKNINNKNFVKKSRILISNNNNQNRYLYNIKKRSVNNGNIKKENIAKEESIKNNFKPKNMNIIKNNKNIISQFQQKNFVLRNRKPINIKNIYNSIQIDNFQTLTSDRAYQSNKIELDEKTKNRIEGNDALYLSKIKSDEIKTSNFHKNQKSLFNMKTTNDSNTQRYRKKTFDKGGKFNNVQTTYIVISKNENTNKIPKVNINPDIIDSNKYKFFNPTPSANCLNMSKLNSTENISPNYPTEFENGRITVNEPRIFIPNRSQNYLPIKRTINYSDFTFNKNNYDTNYKNYIESTNFRNRDILNDIVGRNTCCFINKSSNINQNTIPLYDYNYDYFYGYNNNNHFPNNSYLQYTINTDY